MDRRQFLSCGSVLASGALLGSRVASANEPIRWEMLSSWPRNALGVGTNAQRLVDLINTLSAGRLQITLLAAGEKAAPNAVLDAVAKGVAPLAHTALYYAAEQGPALNFFTTVPFGMTASEFAAWLEFGGGQALKEELLAPLGVRALYAGNSGVQAMGWFRREITRPEDFKGLKMRIAGLGGQALRRLGAEVVMVAPSEINAALASGKLDAAEWIGPWNDSALQLYKNAAFYYLPAWHEPSAALDVVINQQAWASLPAELQAVVQVATQAVAQSASADFLWHNVQSYPALEREHGVKVRQFSEPVIQALGQASREVLQELMAKDAASAKVGQAYLAFLQQAERYNRYFDSAFLNQRALVWG